MPLPAICLVAVPGRRRLTIDIARDIERRGFAGIYAPSIFSNMSLCEALAWNTERIVFGTAIAPIYARTVPDFAQARASSMRYRAGGSASASASRTRRAMRAWGSRRPADQRHARLRREVPRPARPGRCRRSSSPRCGRRWSRWPARSARAWCSPTPPLAHGGLARPSAGGQARRSGVLLGNMIPTCIRDDIEAAKAVCRRTLSSYLLPAELPQLLEGGRLRRGDGGRRARRRRSGRTTCRST